EWEWPYGTIRTFVSDKGAMACFPMKGERRYRLILIPRTASSQPASPDISLEEFSGIANGLCGETLRIEKGDWLARFRVHHRMVKHFRQGRMFLAGDAAHIHSPAGGQGMNTGMQDALNLADKLERVLRKNAEPAILEQYEKERLPVARGVVR